MASEQSITLINQFETQGDPDNVWRVQFAVPPIGPLMGPRVMYTLITPDVYGGDMFAMMDHLTENGLNPGLPRVYIYAMTGAQIALTADKWMLDSPNTLHETHGRAFAL